MLVKVHSIATFGIDLLDVAIETNISNRGFPSFDIVGLANKEISESKHRVITALKNAGVQIPPKKIVINLAPADIPKTGSFLDLPIAVSLLVLLRGYELPKNSLFYGELSLDGSCSYTQKAFLGGLLALSKGYSKYFVPSSCMEDVSYFANFIDIVGVSNLGELITFFESGKLSNYDAKTLNSKADDASFNFGYRSDFSADPSVTFAGAPLCKSPIIIGQHQAKRACLISASGGHNIFMVGPPGVGKTLLATHYPYLLPDLTIEESLEATKIHMISSKFASENSIVTRPPFRSPHHTISYAGMLGGGSIPTPGEISLAHKGVLFMDEFSEFSRSVIEALRQPLETGEIKISRSRGSFTFPSDFVLVAASNPCPCGYLGDSTGKCTCSTREIHNYRKKVSGPILDRIDILVNLSSISAQEVVNLSSEESLGDTSWDLVTLHKEVLRVRDIQRFRFRDAEIHLNSQMGSNHLKKYCILDNAAEVAAKSAIKRFGLSPRAFSKCLKTSRTVADLDGSERIKYEHIMEALNFRNEFLTTI